MSDPELEAMARASWAHLTDHSPAEPWEGATPWERDEYLGDAQVQRAALDAHREAERARKWAESFMGSASSIKPADPSIQSWNQPAAGSLSDNPNPGD